MTKFLPFPLLCRSIDYQESEHSTLSLHSSNSSLASQSSLQSVPSLTPPSNPFELQPSSTGTATAADNHHCLLTLKGQTSHIFSLSLSGKQLYSGDSDGKIRLWDRHPSSSGDGFTVAEGCGAVKSIVILGDKLFTAHQDHKIRVWKIDNSNISSPQQRYKLNATLPTINDRCSKLLSSKNYINVRRHKKRTWVHHNDAVSALSLSKDESLLYSVSWDRSLKVWRTSDFRCLESVQRAHEDAINAVIVSHDGYIYTGSADKKIKVWRQEEDDKKHSLVSILEKHKSAVNALALSVDGSILFSGACDRSIIAWERNDGGGGDAHMVVAGALRGHKKAILCLGTVADLLCSGSADATVRVWRGVGRKYSCLLVFEGHRSPVKCLTAALDNDGGGDGFGGESGKSYLVYSGSLDFEMKVWRICVLPS